MSDQLSRIATALAEARRRSGTAEIDFTPIATLADAYEVQRDSLKALGGEVVAWKVSRLAQPEPGGPTYAGAAMLDRHVWRSLATVRARDFVLAQIECEVAFLLGADLPAREAPYSTDEVVAAVAAVLPVFEIADSRIGPGPTTLAKVADAIGNGGLVTGAPIADWRGLDIDAVAITLTRDGAPFATGSSAAIEGGPLAALVALANAQPLPFRLRAGQVVTTGSCTGMIPMPPGTYRGTFAGLGEVSLRLDP